MATKKPKIEISYENGRYSFILEDENGGAVTQGKTLEEFIENIKECVECHYGEEKYSFEINIPLNLSISKEKYAINLQDSKKNLTGHRSKVLTPSR